MTDAFTRSLANVVVAQVCDGFGFHGIQKSAADTLADIMLRYISALGEGSHAYAEHAGRTESNVNDLLLSLADVGGSLQGIMQYVEYTEEVPFARPVPPFPIRKKQRLKPSTFSQKGELPPNEAIPAWLPALPDKHTYVATPVWEGRPVDPRADQVEQGKERRRAERSLVALHQRMGTLTGMGMGLGRRRWEDMAGGGGGWVRGCEEEAGALHQQRGDSEPSTVDSTAVEQLKLLPPKGLPRLAGLEGKPSGDGVDGAQNANQLPSVMETFAPMLEDMRQRAEESMDMDGDKVEEKALAEQQGRDKPWSGWLRPETRIGAPPVSLSFDWATKLNARALAARRLVQPLRMEQKQQEGKDKREEKGKEDDKDDRRRRAEQILGQTEQDGQPVLSC